MTTIQKLAAEMLAQLHTKTRDSGETFVTMKDGHAEWMTEVAMAAHGDFLPDDFRYSFIQDALASIESADQDDDADALRDQISEWADSDTEVYNGQLSAWLASSLQRGAYVDEGVKEFGFPKDRGIYGAIAIGQLMERQEVYSQLIDALEKRAAETE